MQVGRHDKLEHMAFAEVNLVTALDLLRLKRPVRNQTEGLKCQRT